MSMPEVNYTFIVINNAGRIHDAFDTKENAETLARKLCDEAGGTVYVGQIFTAFACISTIKEKQLL